MIARDQPNYQAVSRGQLWFGLATGAVTWSLHLVISYALISLACERGLLRSGNEFATVRWVILGLTVVAAAVVLSAGLVAYRHWRHLRQSAAPNGGATGERFRFMALLGVLLNSLFALAILVTLFPVLTLPLCD